MTSLTATYQKRVMMKCGHFAIALVKQGATTGSALCLHCGETAQDVGFKDEMLKGRFAECIHCDKVTASGTRCLRMFQYRPKEKNDGFWCGEIRKIDANNTNA
jgi:hypothetical protein